MYVCMYVCMYVYIYIYAKSFVNQVKSWSHIFLCAVGVCQCENSFLSFLATYRNDLEHIVSRCYALLE